MLHLMVPTSKKKKLLSELSEKLSQALQQLQLHILEFSEMNTGFFARRLRRVEKKVYMLHLLK